MTPATTPQRPLLLLALLALMAVALVAVLVPFYGTLLWALIIALLFAPLQRWLLPRVGGRRSVAALLTMLVVLLIVVLPFVLITMGLVSEAAALYERLKSADLDPAAAFRRMVEGLPQWATKPLRSVGLGDVDHLQVQLGQMLSRGGQMLAARALQFGQNTFDLVISLFVMLYIAFFLLRDGQALVQTLRHAVPLSRVHQSRLMRKFSTVIRATVKGNMLVAALQGALGGLAFWVLDVRGALLWAVLMGFLSLLPAIGAALVWVPVALYFLSTGDIVRGVAMAAWGALVIGLVDNLLRPLLVGQDTRLPDWVVLITTLGGMALFGFHGFVLGPVIAGMFLAVWQITVMHEPAEATDDGAPGV